MEPMNVYEAWAMAAWAASASISVIAIVIGCLKYNKRNHIERMRELQIKESKVLNAQFDKLSELPTAVKAERD